MANPSRDWRQDRSRNHRPGQSYRDYESDRRDFERSAAFGRSAEGIGDYGGYGGGGRGAYREEERAYRSEFSPLSGRRYGHPDRDEGRDGVQERYGSAAGSRGAYGHESRSDRDREGPSSFAYGRDERGGDWSQDRYPHDLQRHGQQQSNYQQDDYQRDYGEDPGRRWGSDSRYGNDRDSQSQSHRGKGPKGYQRSDERLKEVICERLTDDPRIDASEITLTVSGGTVKLTGLVDNRRDKFEVEELVSQCSGVKDVDNQLRVQSGFAAGRDLSLSPNAGYAATGLDSSSGSRRPEAPSTNSGLSSPAKKQ